MTDIDIERYMDLFCHRRDVFAVQHEGGTYTPVRRPLTEDDVQEHLDGLWSIGTYVVLPDWTMDGGGLDGHGARTHTVKYVCFDLDTHDQETTDTLCKLVSRLALGVHMDDPDARLSLLKESSGNKGTHVWLFFTDPLPAVQVRRWLQRDFIPEWVSATGGATLEIFPKQDEVPEGGFGNLVKLPLGVHAVSGKRSEILSAQGWAEAVCDVQPLDSSLVPDYPPVETTASRRAAAHGGSRGGPTSPFPCVDQVLYEGAGQGQRNQAMFHLALYCYGHAVPEDLAHEMCQRSNEEFDPPLSDKELDSIVNQAYSGRYQAANCGSDWLRSYCKGPCRAGWTVVAKPPEAGTLRSSQEGSVVEVQVMRKTADGGRVRLTVGHKDAINQPTLICE